ncbi:FAD-binding protein [Streptomyces europaeiscabiei]|uniref:FAD-binding protein n=1 Tax=Streptomyces europaeiscabiei TaxID=146819 RepID=UPI002E0F2501|nr:FAD-binding protein [Streptomyces europaeiscabiei]
MWFSATGKRFSAPDIPGYDTLHTLKTITDTGYDHSWFVTTRRSSPRSSRSPAPSRTETVRGMNKLTGENLIDLADLTRQIEARDREIDNEYSKDAQVMGIRNALRYPGHSISRTASAHKIMNTSAHPLIAVRLNILTRKSLGGLRTDLSGRVLNASGDPVPGLYAAGEVAGIGGGGVHGYRSLEGTFLGGCLFSGRQSGKAAAEATA